MEKRIDEVCRILRDYIETENGDIKLQKKLSDLFCRLSCTKDNSDHIYFIRSLRREFKEPEVMNRKRYGRPVYFKTDYEWQPLDE